MSFTAAVAALSHAGLELGVDAGDGAAHVGRHRFRGDHALHVGRRQEHGLVLGDILAHELYASLTNKVFYANPNKAGIKFVRKDIAENKTVFLAPADMQRMIAPEAVPADVRRSITRIYTKFKTGM